MSDEPEKDADRLGPWLRLAAILSIMVGCGCVFAIAGAFVGIWIYSLRWPDGNLAGLVGLFNGSRIGLVVGLIVGGIACLIWRAFRLDASAGNQG